MRKPKAGTLKRPTPPVFPPKPPRKFKGGKRPGPSPFPERPKPTGPDYVGPYSIKGTAGPVNETVSKVRDIMKDTPSRPIPYQKKGGSMKKLGCAQCGGNKMSDGGNTSNRLERLTKKIDRKTQKGKTVSSGLTRRYDKAVDKVIMSGFKKKTGGATLSKSAIKKAPVQLYGMPQENMGTSGQHGFKKGGAQNAKLAAIAAPKNKITRRDIITAAKKNAKKK
jgi:hypothetical protein